MKKMMSYRLVGVAPLLQHNGQLADPLNQWAKALKKITGKAKKTEADHEELARLEWMGGLYLYKGAPCIPGIAYQATLINAAKSLKKGAKAKAGLVCEDNFPLQYDGPADPMMLWADERFRDRTSMCVGGKNRVMRTRPRFETWSADITVAFNDELLNPDDIHDFIRIGGDQIGLLEGRPRYGRYQATKL
jgi:hypothetical protein